MRVFTDTGAFAALQDDCDRHHPAAAGFMRSPPPSCRFYTSNFIVDETITLLRNRVGHESAAAFADAMLQTSRFEIVSVDSAVERSAVEVFRRFKDKKLSFTDCVTISLVKSLRLDGVFGFDSDFTAVGLRLFPGV